ncbi:spermidine/putrescine transport system permease protein PotB [Pleomorphomonas sp. SM30]|uniref:Putative spermidine/putrescine transport system permease protein n=2 Tax=Oharaeibacter diazotrophicus TaxID=1920512 RepID=A0A4R6R969_9HYPH|nr:putative spermidine/putrescine transport system permease protein [Oharaeibacter diazotrophicus]BBE72734.1 spermidine/putrescine transport system permease protein PotB [Pleomorphomonas sp. SM30]GLS76770.1 ABC transporter [Oharaeibacter diazotrophicus]
MTTTAAAAARRKTAGAMIGVTPFFLFAILFLLLPTGILIVGAFQDSQTGAFTLANFGDLLQPSILSAFRISIYVSATSALGGALLGFALAYAAVLGKLPGWIRPTLTTFSGVASQFAGVPLAFAFISTLGRLGLVTLLLRDLLGFNLYATGFNLLTFWGLTLTYLYFQIPLMVLVVTPALDGLRKEWREAAQILGASPLQYWRWVAGPILWPSVMGATLLLFANAFGAIATAYALTGSSLNIITILLYAQIRGDVLHNANLGFAIAVGMIAITAASNLLYIWLRARSERWLK